MHWNPDPALTQEVKEEASALKQGEEQIKVAIRAAHKRGPLTYGTEEVQDGVAEEELMEIKLNRVKRLRRLTKIRFTNYSGR